MNYISNTDAFGYQCLGNYKVGAYVPGRTHPLLSKFKSFSTPYHTHIPLLNKLASLFTYYMHHRKNHLT